MAGTHNYWLVLLAVLVATMASFVGLDIARRTADARKGVGRLSWIVAGALAMGLGIWTMHFIGMLGFHLPIVVSYAVDLTLLSLALAVAGCGAAFALVSGTTPGAGRLLTSGSLIGAAIVSMHYTGMAAMKIVPSIRYDAWIVSLSIAIAVAASTFGLWGLNRWVSEDALAALPKKLGSAVILGGAIYGMHYTGMAAATFAPGSRSLVKPPHAFDPTTLAVLLGAIALVFLLVILLISTYYELRAMQLGVHAERLGRTAGRAQQEVRDLSSRLVELQDAERRRLATELHDIVGQNLAALLVELTLIRNQLAEYPQPGLHKSLDDAVLLAKQSTESVRQVMAQLRPPGVDELGLPAALRWHASALASRTAIAVKVDADESLARPNPAVEDALLRIYVEALANIAKHASAQEVRVRLKLVDEYVILSIADDGRGFDVEAYKPSGDSRWGLAIMRERGAAAGGEVQIRSAPGAGTEVEFSISKARWH